MKTTEMTMRSVFLPLTAAMMVATALAACDRGSQGPARPAASGAATGQVPVASPDPALDAQGPVVLEDVVETTPDYLVGISYPPDAGRYPGLAAAMQRYAESARSDLMEAVQARPQGEARTMYDLSLSFTQVAETPELVAVAADGSSFTGGAHGTPLLARFVWLPGTQRMLEAKDLIADEEGWRVVSSYVREQLHGSLSQRVDADRLDPQVRAEVVSDAGRLIDEGTEPDPENFGNMEPVIGAGGKIEAVRFVFAPYQVGPYSDGVQAVQVPASVLRPHVAERYRGLFSAS